MDLNAEYLQDLKIQGKDCVLNFVENIEHADHFLIRRHYITRELTKITVDEKVAKAVASAQLPVASEAVATAAAEASEPKRSMLGKLFGGKKKAKKA